MAIIYGYPIGTPTAKDNLLGTQVNPVTEENKTVQFPIGSVGTLLTQGYVETTIVLTAVQLLALNTTAVQLRPSPGGTQVIKLLEVSTFLDRDVSFTSVGSAGIDLLIGTSNQARITPALYTAAASTVASLTTPFVNGTITSTLPLFATTATAILLGGTSSLSIKIRYQILDTSAF